MLEVRDLNTYYGRAHILQDLSLDVAQGEVVALLGRNGAGKSTTLKSVVGLVPPASGQIRFMGREVRGQAPHRVARAGIGYVPEERRIFASLSVLDNLEVGRQPVRAGVAPWTPERLFRLFPNLAAMTRRLGGQMSGGEQQMLTIARTLMGNPLLMLLDEPSEGLAPVIVEQMADAVMAMKHEGLSVLLSEQNLEFATRVADRACVIEKGTIKYAGTIDELLHDDGVRQSYLTV